MTRALIAGISPVPLVFYVVPPHGAQDSDDLRIVICALPGKKALTLALARADACGNPKFCPALVLPHLTGSASLPDVFPIAAITPFAFAIGTMPSTRRGPHPLAYAMRAPPRA